MRAGIHAFEMARPDDMSGLEAALEEGRIAAEDIVCIMAKTEGNGLDNDHSRPFATMALLRVLGPRLGLDDDALFDRISLILSGGTEGVLSPHMTVYTASATREEPRTGGALAIGRSFTRPIAPEEIGRMAQIGATADAVREAMVAAQIEDPADVAYVMAKGVVLVPETIAEARSRGASLCAADAHGSKPASRGATALGIALALAEVAPDDLSDAMIAKDLDRFGGKACVTAGVDKPRTEILVFGNSPHWAGDFRVASGVMTDLLDVAGAARVLEGLGLTAAPQLGPADRDRLAAILVKGEPSRDGRLRDRRHVMWHDSDVHALRHFRATMSGVLGGLTGETRIYISAGAEHQAPQGGCTIAAFARIPEEAR